MKELEFYLNQPYRMEIIEDKEEGGFTVCFPELKGCITCAETISEALIMADEAKTSWLKACIENKIEIPLPDSKEKYSGQFKLRIPKSLHKTLAMHAKEEGVSMNQYCLAILSKYA